MGCSTEGGGLPRVITKISQKLKVFGSGRYIYLTRISKTRGGLPWWHCLCPICMSRAHAEMNTGMRCSIWQFSKYRVLMLSLIVKFLTKYFLGEPMLKIHKVYNNHRAYLKIHAHPPCHYLAPSLSLPITIIGAYHSA